MGQRKIKHLEKLTPVKNIEKMNTYEEALDFVFNEPDLLNIAITGPYSAGKSSVINTYREENKSIKFMNISLAHFEDLSTDNSNNISKSEIEGKILNQIIHQINPKNIPQTNFKIKSNVSSIKVLITTLFITLLVSIFFYLILFQKWSTHISGLSNESLKKVLLISTSNEFFVFTVGFFLILVGIGLFYLIKKQMERPFLKRVKVEKYEIEVFETEKDSSYFDKHLDDILYLFRNSNMDAFVFEDIDRYNMNFIFSKFREINNLINKNGTNNIRFFYLIRDDIFTSKDRTKFFDLLIPIVPVIDRSNSYDKLLEIFNKGGILSQFDKTFLERLSLYIDDMRILKNIYNEYVIYHESIQETELQTEKLLALITYKNLFPKDFSNLQYNSGHVNKIFSNKDKYINLEREELNRRVKINTALIEKIENENLNNVDELDALYFIHKVQLRINNKYQNSYSNAAEFIKASKSSPNNVINQNGYTVEIESELDKLNAIPEYVERKEIINEKTNNRVFFLQEENAKIKEELKRFNSLKLKKLFSKMNSEDIFEDEENSEITDSAYYDLVKYLIRNGYIDETYSDYLTYFWGQDLSRVDKIFLRSITDEKAKDYLYKLEREEKVVTRLKEGDFEKNEILNFYLLDHLLKNNHPFLPLILNQIKKTRQFDFVFDYIVWTNEIGKFVPALNKIWTTFFIDLLGEPTINKIQMKNYLIETMYHSNIEDVVAMNNNDSLMKYISLSNDFLNIEDPKIDLIIRSLVALNVKFHSINYLTSNKSLFMEVYRNNLYTLNYPMIELVLNEVYLETDQQNQRQKNYTIISSKPDEALKLYIEKNINEYMMTMLDNTKIEIKDSEEAVINILNNKDINAEIKETYLQLLSTVLIDIKKISESMWEVVIQSNNLKPTVDNVLEYYVTYAGMIDTTLKDYLNSSHGLLFSFEKLVNYYNENELKSFFLKIIETNELNNEIYEMVLKESNAVLEAFNSTKIDKEKLTILINLGIITMNNDNLIFIRDNFPNKCPLFISRNIEIYINILNEELIEEKEIIQLLDEDTIPIEQRVKLLKHYNSTISIESRLYPEEIEEYILRHNFDLEDMEYVIKNYLNSSTSIKKAIEDVVIIHFKKLIGVRIESKSLIKEILKRNELNIESKMEFLFPMLSYLTKEEIKEYLKIINQDEFLSLFEGKRPKIKILDINQKFLNYFKENGWISTFEIDSSDSNFYRAIGKMTAIRQ